MRLHNLGIARKLWLGVIFLILANVVIVGFSGVRTAKLRHALLDTQDALKPVEQIDTCEICV